MALGLFVTGTDTGVGKTRIGAALAAQCAARGLRVRARKPVESGCATRDNALLPADAEALRRAAGAREPLDTVCPYPFAAPLSPPRAAALAGRRLQLAQLVGACTVKLSANDFLLVEGAGGFLSPLADDALNADLAVALGLAVLLVGDDRLGAVHQVLATAEAVERRGLRLAGVILNAVREPPDPRLENVPAIAAHIDAPLLSLPYQPAAGAALSEAWVARVLSRCT